MFARWLDGSHLIAILCNYNQSRRFSQNTALASGCHGIVSPRIWALRTRTGMKTSKPIYSYLSVAQPKNDSTYSPARPKSLIDGTKTLSTKRTYPLPCAHARTHNQISVQRLAYIHTGLSSFSSISRARNKGNRHWRKGRVERASQTRTHTRVRWARKKTRSQSTSRKSTKRRKESRLETGGRTGGLRRTDYISHCPRIARWWRSLFA
jgi:hypothetical protein